MKYIENSLSHLYISPLESCNLACKICYTTKNKNILSEKEIKSFISRYKNSCNLKMITFCGGEVFLLPYFCNLINFLISQNIFIQIITNGTIDRLSEIDNPNSVNIIVSIDGLEEYHDKNRGNGNFKKSLDFLKKAQSKGFHIEVFSIITRQNISKIDDFDFLNEDEILFLMNTKQTFPPKNLGCYQISLMSDQNIYGCCEATNSIGKMNDNIEDIIISFRKSIIVKNNDLGCCDRCFLCGLKNILG